MNYGRGLHQSARAMPAEGPAFVYTAENRAKLEEICARYPAERRKSAILAALYLAQAQQGHLTLNAMRHVAEAIGCTTAEVEEMIGPAVFLASGESSYVTGQTFYVDGGWTVQGMVPASNVQKAAKKNK
jgi:NAD(P)-dependent dehydrogenase (short-subunit alcohol dehydrogenase family)